METFECILHIFKSTLNVGLWNCPHIYKEQYELLVKSIGAPSIVTGDMPGVIICSIVEKFDLYHNRIRTLYNECAKENVYFNYIEKQSINLYYKLRAKESLVNLLASKGLSNERIKKQIESPFLTDEEILNNFSKNIESDKHYSDILESLLSSFIYNLFPEEKIQEYNSKSKTKELFFYNFLRKEFPFKYARTHTLSVVNLTTDLLLSFDSYDDFLSSMCVYIKDQYTSLQNYCYLGVIIEPIYENGISMQWKIYSDIVLYAEKFIEEKLNIGYFHPQKIKEQTVNYIKETDVNSAKFDVCNSGFTYKDCFIIADKNHLINEREIYSDYKILVLFQKNERDEDIIPCPKCRSYNVRGNSYPVIGVKSWECNNPLCPDKSKYNRGKRYSMAQIIKQEAIKDEKNQIDEKTLKDWRLDVVNYKTDIEIVDYLIKEYTFYNDIVYLYNLEIRNSKIAGRKIKCLPFEFKGERSLLKFYNSCYFKRFIINNTPQTIKTNNISNHKRHQVFNNDCLDVLASLSENTIDGAVTSPPYYNAREYSHWSNIYCYLYDMYNHARYLYKTLKPGAYYLYNIFDYFDNENNVVFSEMGKKRMILGAYIIHLFTVIGYELCQNIIWYKGHVQGNRATNQGNHSPYYQAPINCYEHVLCFRKPSRDVKKLIFPQIINVFPVVKIIQGKNILGHTAPFPHEIPDLLASRIKGTIIDPYSGSFTTARSAEKYNINSISIEKSKEYCLLGIKLLEKTIKSHQPSLFDSLEENK